jgi:hypothetical protein
MVRRVLRWFADLPLTMVATSSLMVGLIFTSSHMLGLVFSSMERKAQ